MIQALNNKTENAADEVSIWIVIEYIKSGWRWLVCGLIVGLVSAIGFLAVVPAQYEAIAIIQPATVGLSPVTTTMTMTTTTKGADVESAAQTLEHLKLATFYTDQLVNACDIQSKANSRQALAMAMKPNLVKGNGLIQISYRAASPAIAEACVAGVVNQLAKVQAEIAAPLLKRLEEQRQITKQQLDDAERFQNQIEKRVLTMDPSGAQFSQSMLLLSAALSKKEEISKLKKAFAEQSVLLSEPFTQPTKLFEPIYVSDRAVFPKKGITIAVGLLSGLFLGLLTVFVSGSWRRFKANGK